MPIDDDLPEFLKPKPVSNSASFTPLEIAEQAKNELTKWLDDHPAITNDDEAREAKLIFDRAKSSYGDLETARNAETQPLHAAWQSAISKFKPMVESFGKFVNMLDGRMQTYLREKKRKADEAAAEAVRKAQEAERIAREAEAKEREAVENASLGEIGAGVAQATAQADQAFEDAQRAARDAARSVRETHVKIGGGFSGRSMGLRTEKVQILDDVNAAIKEIGLTDDIREAVLKSARAFKKLNNRWPAGVREETK